MNLSMPTNMPQTTPGPTIADQYHFDHIPSLAELLPQFRGLPGFEYMQCCVSNLRRAQDEGWVEVEKTVIYTVKGPKGSVDMKLLARGKRIPGQPHNSGARLCLCDKTVESLSGLWINPHKHQETTVPDEPTPKVESVATHNTVGVETPQTYVPSKQLKKEPKKEPSNGP